MFSRNTRKTSIMFSATNLVILVTIIHLFNAKSYLTTTTDRRITIRIPDLKPDHADQYLCMAHRIPANPEGHFIVGFNPKSDSSRVHHMLMYGCEEPGIYQRDSPNFVWDCSEMHSAKDEDASSRETFEQASVCKNNLAHKIMYGWAMDAPSLKLPDGVGFKVGGLDTNINFLVLQVHYGQIDGFQKLPDLTDNSGLTLDLRPNTEGSGITKQAGVLVLISLGNVLEGESKHEIWCDMDEDIEIHPFRYRVHTHKLGTRVMGAKLAGKQRIGSNQLIERDNNQIIGEGDPQKPQMFYPVKEKDLVLRQGDSIYARCDFNNNRSHIVKIGQTGDDEMCNFYIMYWTNSTKLLSKDSCMSVNPRRMFDLW